MWLQDRKEKEKEEEEDDEDADDDDDVCRLLLNKLLWYYDL